MSLDLTVTDLFCGAGGSSIGAERMGATLRMAANHWSLAIETHAANFPGADHDCADISQVDPRRYPSTDILLASPECTHHSQARTKKHRDNLFNPNGDPAAERSRATMWDVPRFAERHRYQLVIVENVVEVTRWEPFDAWLLSMTSLGYEYQLVSLNSMVAHPTPQSRDRLYIVFWRKGNRAPDLDIRPPAWCSSCEDVVGAVQTFKRPDRRAGKYRQQYLYRCPTCDEVAHPIAMPAASAIDWSLPCPRIGDRKRPLAEATMERIRIGLERFFSDPFVMVNRTHNRPRSLGEPLAPMCTADHQGIVVPTHHGACGPRARDAGEPWPTQTGRAEHGLACPPAFFLKNYGNADEAKYRSHPIDHPLGAVTGRDSHAIVAPFIAELRGGGSKVRSVEQPAATVTADGNHHGLVMPPSLYVKGYGTPDKAGPMTKPLTIPFGAVTTKDHHGLLGLPFTVDYHRNGRAQGLDVPLRTQDTRDRHAIVAPRPEVEDCGFRMLEPHEIQRAMAFPDDYAVAGTNKRDRVKQLGNAVTPPAMSILVERGIASLAP